MLQFPFKYKTAFIRIICKTIEKIIIIWPTQKIGIIIVEYYTLLKLLILRFIVLKRKWYYIELNIVY